MRWLGLAFCGLLVFGVGCKGKSPEDVCNHMIDLAKKADAEKGKKLEAKKDECVKELEGMKKEVGDEKYNKFAACVVDSSDMKDAEGKCEELIKGK